METAVLELEAAPATRLGGAPAGAWGDGPVLVGLEYLFPDLPDSPLLQPVWRTAGGREALDGGRRPATPLRAFAERGSNQAAALKLLSALRRVARLGTAYCLRTGRWMTDHGMGIAGVPVEGTAVEALAYHEEASGSLVLLGVARASPGTAAYRHALRLASEAAGRLSSLAPGIEPPQPPAPHRARSREEEVARLLGDHVNETADTLGYELSCAFSAQAALEMRERGIEPADLPAIVEGALFGTPCMTLRSVARVALTLGAGIDPPRLGASGGGADRADSKRSSR